MSQKKDLSNRFADAIRRIVEPLIEKPSEDKSLVDKASIVASRGIGYNDVSGVNGLSGSPGSTLAPETALSIRQTASDAAASAAQTAAASLLGAVGSGQGSFDAQDLLDQTTNPLPPGTFADDAVNGALSIITNTPNGASKVLELTGLKQCGTSNAISVRFDGNFPPPSTWDDANTPPVDTDYHEGFYWTLISGSTHLFSNYFTGLVGLREALDGTTAYGVSGGVVISKPPHSGESVQFGAAGYNIGDPTGPIGGTVYSYQSGGSVGVGEYGMESCTGGDTGSGAACSADPPTSRFWPTTGTGRLTRDETGSFIASVYDSEIPSVYTEPSSTLNACTTSNTPIEIVGLKNGGWAFYEVSGGLPTGVIQIYNKDNTLAGYTDSTGLANLLPEP